MKPKSSLLVILLSTSAFILPAIGETADFSKIDLNALLRLRYTRVSVGLPPIGGPRESFTDASVLITKGGAVFLEGSSRENPLGAPVAFETFLMRGVANPTERSRFTAALDRAKPGIQRDCSAVIDGERIWDHEVTWYGRGSRRQEFRVLLQNQPNSSLPTCPQEVVDLIFSVIFLLSDVQSHRDTELLHSGLP